MDPGPCFVYVHKGGVKCFHYAKIPVSVQSQIERFGSVQSYRNMARTIPSGWPGLIVKCRFIFLG